MFNIKFNETNLVLLMLLFFSINWSNVKMLDLGKSQNDL